MRELNLTDNLRLTCTESLVLIEDLRAPQALPEGLYLQHEGRAILCAIEVGAVSPSCPHLAVDQITTETPNPIYGRKLIEATAMRAGEECELWRIQADPGHTSVTWTRQPAQTGQRLSFRMLAPASKEMFQLWRTDRGAQAMLSPHTVSIEADDVAELVCLSRSRRNSFRLALNVAGRVSVSPQELEPEDSLSPVGERVWEVRWMVPAAALVQLTISWGPTAAARDAAEAREFECVDASADFGTFYSYMALSALVLHVDTVSPAELIDSCLINALPELPGLDELSWWGEFAYLLSPAAVAAMLKEVVARAISGIVEADEALFLPFIAWRYLHISGDIKQITAWLPDLIACGRKIIAQCGPNEALPIFHLPRHPLGELRGKDPYTAAFAHASLRRLAELEDVVTGDAAESIWKLRAEAIRLAAASPAELGGLNHPGRPGWILAQEYGVQETTEAPAVNAGDGPAESAVPRLEYAHFQHISALYLGLAQDPQLEPKLFDWLDDTYTYATGRGGATFPPHMQRTFFALLEIYLRKQAGLRGVNRLLQRVLDQAFALGAPLPASPPDQFGGSRGRDASMASGSILDAAAYFGLVIHHHYGLEYSARGWRIDEPRLLGYYRLTRVTGLRHGHAVYAISWQGRGQVRRITVDGQPHHSRWLEGKEGEHEVCVYLS